MTLPFPKPIRYCISEGDITTTNFSRKKKEIVANVQRAGDRGINLFQIREKCLEARLLFDLVRSVVEAACETNTRILVNGRFDIALSAGAHGVHLPSNGIPAGRLRVSGSDFIIGVSAHSVAEIRAAKSDGADFVVFGPVFASPGKGSGLGLKKLRDACLAVAPFPVLALGGIDGSNIDKVCCSGAAGYSAIRYLNEVISSERC